MTSIIPFTLSRRATTNRRALDRLIAAYARTHDAHEAPLVGCYLCLHGVARRTDDLAAAA